LSWRAKKSRRHKTGAQLFKHYSHPASTNLQISAFEHMSSVVPKRTTIVTGRSQWRYGANGAAWPLCSMQPNELVEGSPLIISQVSYDSTEARMAWLNGLTADDLALTKIIDRIILGPTTSSPIANATVSRMFDILNQSGLKPKLRGSTIPFRAIG
jgi:hypothetical protein